MAERTGFFDTETTGLMLPRCVPLVAQPRCIEICILIYEGEKQVDRMSETINPNQSIGSHITRITGISNADLRNRPRWASFCQSVKEKIESCDTVVAHNFTFDQQIVDCEMRRIKQSISWPQKRVCTVEATEWLKGHRVKLGDLYEFCMKAPMAKAHRAEIDVEAMAQCYFYLQRKGWI